MDYQRIMLIGNTALNAEKSEDGGKRYADFTVIVRNRNGESTDYPVRCCGKLAEVEEIKAIGMETRIFVEGEPEISEHTGEHGANCIPLRVIVTTLRILSSSRRRMESRRSKKRKRAGSSEMSDEDLPF